jgi:hypothetical protein
LYAQLEVERGLARDAMARLIQRAQSADPELVPLSMGELGRGAEALAALRELEPKIPTRVRDLVTAARFLLEGKAADS